MEKKKNVIGKHTPENVIFNIINYGVLTLLTLSLIHI